MRINNNLMAMNTHRQLGINAGNGAKSIEKLSSGYRINRAGDDAAGLAISEKMRAQIRGLSQASRNSQDAISLVQTAEGALNETQDILQRMRELAVQSANDTNVTVDRGAIQNEIDQLTQEVDRIATTTEFNTRKLLNGGAGINATSNNANVSIIGGSADVKGGNTLSLTGFTSATTATLMFDDSGNQVDMAAGGGTMVLNGVSITTAGTETEDELITLINSQQGSTGVTASYTGAFGAAGNFQLTFTSISKGSAATIDVQGVNNVLDANTQLNLGGVAAAVTGGTDAGADATITINAGATDGVDPTQYTAKGNVVTINDGDYQGLQIKIADGAATAAVTMEIISNGSLSMQIGANEGQDMSVSISDMRATALGVNSIDVTTSSNAKSAITTIQDAITGVSSERAKLGAVQNRLEHTIKNLDTSAENLQASESRIRDVDMAKEMMNFTKNNILQQAAQAMLAQANQAPQGVLQLLR